jgi:dipeptidase
MKGLYSQLICALALSTAYGCSNLLVTPGASADGSSMISYNADSGELYGSLYHYPAADHAVGDMRQIYDWDTGAYLGEIPEANHTYNVIGNVNEYGVTIGETTYGGLEELCSQSNAVIDYGSLIYVTLQRSKTAREAIKVASELMATYGYASEGESFSIGDPNEVWIMEIIGKGEVELGAVWVAMKIPDGYVSGHANQARITTFPLDDPDNCLYADDVISFAQSQGYYPTDAADEDFDFSGTYDPVTFEGARFCEGRVWSFFGNITSTEWAAEYQDYAMGYNLTNRMPLWVKPTELISVADVEQHMRNHFEGTALALDADVGAGDGNSPYRKHPLTWTAPSYDGSYLNERPIGTQQTGWNYVSTMRSWMPYPLQAVIWFGVDDSGATARFPAYGCATEAPTGWAGQGPQDGVVPPMMKFDMTQPFMVFNLVANMAYPRWSEAAPIIHARAIANSQAFSEALATQDAALLEMTDTDDILAAATSFTAESGASLLSDWTALFGELFLRLRDGYTVVADEDSTSCGCSISNSPYTGVWYDRIVADTGDHYADIPDEVTAPKTGVRKPAVKSKLTLKALR